MEMAEDNQVQNNQDQAYATSPKRYPLGETEVTQGQTHQSIAETPPTAVSHAQENEVAQVAPSVVIIRQKLKIDGRAKQATTASRLESRVSS